MEMDSYRVGTLLELVREAALGFAQHGLRCRVCVQGSMGEGAFMGVPRVLSGVNKLLAMMDWQAMPGEPFEGALEYPIKGWANPDAPEGFVRFGAVGPNELTDDDDVIIILAPQSMVGASIYEPLSEMVEKATSMGKAVITLNPLLQDRQSSGGLMSVRGRSERLAFADSFEEIYHFRLLYSGTTFMFPILGALRFANAYSTPASTAGGAGGGDGGAHENAPASYVLFQRRESGGQEERYEPVGSFPGREPTVAEISSLVPKAVQPFLDADGEASAAAGAAAEVVPTGRSAPKPATATDKFAAPSWE